ncbi:MAG: ribonuclease Y [Patescibacteria group bacterium]
MSFFSNLSQLFGPHQANNQPATKSKDEQNSLAKTRSDKAAGGFQRTSAAGKIIAVRDKHKKLASEQAQAQVSSQAQPQAQLQSKTAARPIFTPSASLVAAVDNSTVVREAQAKAREIIVEAKDEALAIRSRAEKESRESERELAEQQRFLQSKLDRLDHRLEQLDQKEEQVNKERQQLDSLKQSLEESKASILQKLEKVSKMTQTEAKQALMDSLDKKLANEMAQMVRQRQEEAKQEADERVKEILIDSMKHGATDYVAEYTVSVVDLPGEDVKGKIIGKSGRNIHAFERATGVDIDLDSSPTEVKLSCFDPVRREIAKIALERLIKDGRIQPARIEEVVEKVTADVEKLMFEAGKKLCHTVGIYNLPNGLIKILGRFKYRFSYGQNMITHTIEETKIGIKLAHELNLDANVVKLGCLLHDIGKVSEETEGSHVELGVKIAKKFGMPQSVIDCIAQHHEDESFSGPEQMAVYIADAISGARPGARYENFDEYVQRLEKLEEIATSHESVKQAYAVQAGRELRVLLEAEKSKDDDVEVLAIKIKDEIQEKVTFPGTVKVTVIRETRGQAVAK